MIMVTRKRSTFSVILVALVVLSLALTACGSDDDKDDKELTPVGIQFSWVHTIEFAGFYAADEEGYYKDAGLEVTFNGGGYDDAGQYIDPIQRVIDGESLFGVTDAGGLLQARAAGQPLVAIGAIYQQSPAVLMSLADTGITRPQDLLGKRIYTDESNLAVPYRAFLAAEDISTDDITEIPKTDFTLNPLLNGEVDAMLCFITNEVVQARELGHDVNVLVLSNYGIEIYANVIFTTEDTIANQPDLVEKFLGASTKGLQWSVDEPQKAAELVLKRYGDTMTEELKMVQEPGMIASGPLLHPAAMETGMMTEAAWQFTYETLQDQGILTEPLDPSAAYTLDFLSKIYD